MHVFLLLIYDYYYDSYYYLHIATTTQMLERQMHRRSCMLPWMCKRRITCNFGCTCDGGRPLSGHHLISLHIAGCLIATDSFSVFENMAQASRTGKCHEGFSIPSSQATTLFDAVIQHRWPARMLPMQPVVDGHASPEPPAAGGDTAVLSRTSSSPMLRERLGLGFRAQCSRIKNPNTCGKLDTTGTCSCSASTYRGSRADSMMKAKPKGTYI